MIAAAVSMLCVAFVWPMGDIIRSIWLEELVDATARDIARLTAVTLPPPRDDLLPEDWGTPPHWRSPTGEFWAIVEQLGDLGKPCVHCTTPEDGEPAHAACPGCACPCSLAPTLEPARLTGSS